MRMTVTTTATRITIIRTHICIRMRTITQISTRVGLRAGIFYAF
jgi:hypothetical protein